MMLIAELKRRNVFKVGVAYLALAWVVVQATGAIVPALNLPDSLVPTVVWIGIIGFPCTIIFSWVYELTPEGLRRESEVDRSQSITHVTSKRLDTIIIGMLAVAMLMFAVDRFLARDAAPGADSRAEARPTEPAVSLSESDSVAPVGRASARQDQPATAPAPDENSIAVLPFADMSQGKDQEYFSDGISEELLNLLAKIPELRVISRTSSFSYKGKDVKLEQIGRELQVAHVLEGSVRKAGNTLRITAQLIRTSDSTHLWSETYDRPLDNIFAVQDEIAGAVVGQLKIKLLGAVPKVRRVDPEAYALFLRAVQQDRLYTHASMEQAFTLYQQALAIDPGYAAAWSGAAGFYSQQAFLGLGPRSADENVRLAREALTKALEADPGYAPAYAQIGWIAKVYDNDLAAAARHIERALALDPSHPSVIVQASALLVGLGRMDRAIVIAEYLAALDPLFDAGHAWVGEIFHRAGRDDEALAKFRTALLLNPDGIGNHMFLGMVLLFQGDQEAALTEMQAEPDEGWRLTGLALVYHALGRKAESDAALAELIEKHEKSWSDTIAWVLAYRGETDAAFERMEKAVAYHSMGVVHFPVEPLMSNLHHDPRWLPFLHKLGKTPEQLAAIPFDVKLPGTP